MSKWTLKLLGGVVETTGTTSTINIPRNLQSHKVTYIVKYEDDNGNSGETSVRQASGDTQLTITEIAIKSLSDSGGYNGLVAYDNRTTDLPVTFKYTYNGGKPRDVDASWFKFSLQDKYRNQIAVLENPILDLNSFSGTVYVPLSIFSRLPTGVNGSATHSIQAETRYSSMYYHDDVQPLGTNYYNDPDDRMALYSIVADTRPKLYNTLFIDNRYTPPQSAYTSNVFLKASSTPAIVDIRLGIWAHWPGQEQPFYRCIESNPMPYRNIYCLNYYEGNLSYEEGVSLSVEYNVAGSLTTSDKTTLQVCNASDDSVIYEFEITYLYNPIVPQWNYYGNTCKSSNIMSYNSWISFKDTLNLAPNSGVYNIYVRWKDDPSIRTRNLEVDTQAPYCGS